MTVRFVMLRTNHGTQQFTVSQAVREQSKIFFVCVVNLSLEAKENSKSPLKSVLGRSQEPQLFWHCKFRRDGNSTGRPNLFRMHIIAVCGSSNGVLSSWLIK